MKIRSGRAIACLAAAVALVLGAAACTEEAPPAKAGELPILEITGTGGGPAANFNPFLPTSALNAYSAVSMIYEPLVQFNILKEGSTYPWLATAWTWSDGDKTLTFKLRDGVKWTDGQPFTSADVVFTFELMKKYAALNVNGVDFASITAPDDKTVVMTLQDAGVHPVVRDRRADADRLQAHLVGGAGSGQVPGPESGRHRSVRLQVLQPAADGAGEERQVLAAGQTRSAAVALSRTELRDGRYQVTVR